MYDIGFSNCTFSAELKSSSPDPYSATLSQ